MRRGLIDAYQSIRVRGVECCPSQPLTGLSAYRPGYQPPCTAELFTPRGAMPRGAGSACCSRHPVDSLKGLSQDGPLGQCRVTICRRWPCIGPAAGIVAWKCGCLSSLTLM